MKFRDLDPTDRLAAVCSTAHLSKSEPQALSGESVLPIYLANGMIENVIGKFELQKQLGQTTVSIDRH